MTMKNIGFVLVIIGVIVLLCFSTYMMVLTGLMIESSQDKTYIVIEDEIIDTSTVLNKDGSLDYITVTFSDGESYDIQPSKETDLTVNSRLIIELFRFNNKDYFDTDVWHIKSIIKVPDVGE